MFPWHHFCPTTYLPSVWLFQHWFQYLHWLQLGQTMHIMAGPR